MDRVKGKVALIDQPQLAVGADSDVLALTTRSPQPSVRSAVGFSESGGSRRSRLLGARLMEGLRGIVS